MPVQLSAMRDLLLPGLQQVTALQYSFVHTKEIFAANVFGRAVSAPHIWIPKLSIPQAVALGAAAAIIKNPEVTRRFWAGWFSPTGS